MEFLKKLIEEEEYVKLVHEVTTGSEISTKELKLSAYSVLNESDFEDLHINFEQYFNYNEMRYCLS